jgi:hypothetical protein
MLTVPTAEVHRGAYYSQTAKKYKSTSDMIERILGNFKDYFDRLVVHLNHDIPTNLRHNIVESLALFLRMIGLTTRITRLSPTSLLS